MNQVETKLFDLLNSIDFRFEDYRHVFKMAKLTIL